MRFIVLLLLTSLVGGAAQGQKKVAEFEHQVFKDSYDYVIYRDLDYDSEAKLLSIYGMKWQRASLYAVQEDKRISVPGTFTIPKVYKADLKTNGDNKIIEEAINLQSLERYQLKGADYEAEDLINREVFTSSKDALSSSELKEKYPKAFYVPTKTVSLYQLEVQNFWKSFAISETLQEYKFKDTESKLIKGDKSTRSIKPTLDSDFKVFPDKYNVVDNKRRMAIVPVQLAKKKEKLHGFRNKRVHTIDSEGKIVNQFDLKYEFPKSLIFATGLGHSAEDSLSNFEDGAILIYGRAFGVGKKNNDPDKTRYYVAIMDGSGALLYENEFKYGTEKRSLDPYYAYKSGDNIHVFGKAVGNDNPGYAVLTFNSTGLIDTKEYGYEPFGTMGEGNKSDGLNSNYARKFYPISHHNLSNGDVLIHGESYESTTVREERELPAGASTTPSFITKEVKNFMGHVFLLLNKDGELKSHFTLAKKSEKSKKRITQLRKIQDVNGKIYFVGEEDEGSDTYAMLIKVDYQNKQIARTDLSNHDIYDIRGKVTSRFKADSNEVIFIGRTADKETFTIKSAVFSLD